MRAHAGIDPGERGIEQELSPGVMIDLGEMYLGCLEMRGEQHLPGVLDEVQRAVLRDGLIAIRELAPGETRGKFGGYAYALRQVINAWWDAHRDMRDADHWWPREFCFFAAEYMARVRLGRARRPEPSQARAPGR